MKPSDAAARLRNVIDPELGIDVVALGLIYSIDTSPNAVAVQMALTSGECPLGATLLQGACASLEKAFPGCAVSVELVEEPAWDIAMADYAELSRLGFVAPS